MEIRTLVAGGYNLWVSTVAGDAIYNIWNGTGILDLGADWTHSGYGIESADARHTGTNGLDITGMGGGDKITFIKQSPPAVDANNYTNLQMWVNIKAWQTGKDINIRFYRGNSFTGNGINLSDYIDPTVVDTWLQANIQLSGFNVPSSHVLPGNPAYVDELRLQANGNIDVWLDDIQFSMSIYQAVAICGPEYLSHEERIGMSAREIKPSMRVFSEPGNL